MASEGEATFDEIYDRTVGHQQQKQRSAARSQRAVGSRGRLLAPVSNTAMRVHHEVAGLGGSLERGNASHAIDADPHVAEMWGMQPHIPAPPPPVWRAAPAPVWSAAPAPQEPRSAHGDVLSEGNSSHVRYVRGGAEFASSGAVSGAASALRRFGRNDSHSAGGRKETYTNYKDWTPDLSKPWQPPF